MSASESSCLGFNFSRIQASTESTTTSPHLKELSAAMCADKSRQSHVIAGAEPSAKDKARGHQARGRLICAYV